MRNRSQESLQCLPRKRPPALVRHCDRQHQRHFPPCGQHGIFRRIDGGFGIQRVENGFHQQRVHPSFQQSVHLLPVGCGQFIERQRTVGRVFHVRTHGTSFIGRPDGTGHETRTGGLHGRELVGQFTGQPRSSQVDFTTTTFHMVIRHGNALCVERVGLDDIRSREQILAVYVGHHVGTGQAQQVVVACHLSGHILKPFTPEVGFRQSVTLYHGAHRTVQHQNPFLDNFL